MEDVKRARGGKRISTAVCKTNRIPLDIAYGIPLHLAKLARLMQGRGYAHGRAVDLGVDLAPVSAQEQSAQIGHLAADKRE